MTDKPKKPLNQKQQYIVDVLKNLLMTSSFVLEKSILQLKEKDKDFMLHIKSLSPDEFLDLYEHFGIDMRGGTVKQMKGHLLSARYDLDVIEDEFVESIPIKEDMN
jgi:hypothetical protein